MTKHNGDIVFPAGGAAQFKNFTPEKVALDPVIDPNEVGRLIFNTVSNTYKYNDGTTWITLGSVAAVGDTAPVYITNVEPSPASTSGNVSSLNFLPGGVLTSFTTSTLTLRVSVITQSGSTNYYPTVTVNGVTATLTNQGIGQWSGYADITIVGSGNITAHHEDGAEHIVAATYDSPPVISLARFTGTYPGSQTELKENDSFSLQVTADKPFTKIHVSDAGACQAGVYTFAATTNKTVTVTIANRGTTPQALPATVRVETAGGALSAAVLTNASGSVDANNVVTLNNTVPVITMGTITYPGSQQALKASESATVNHTVTSYTTIAYTSANGELNISNPSTYEPAKSVNRILGSYNVSVANFTVTAYRSQNGSSTTANAIVQIAAVAPIITLVVPQARLRSGGNAGTSAQNYTIQLSSNQKMPTATASMTANTNGNPGTIIGSWAVVDNYTTSVTLQVHDNDIKGTYSMGNLVSTNLAGISQTTLTSPTYVLGGFVKRVMNIAPWPNREGNIGTTVTNVAKLQCTNLSKGPSSSLNYTYSVNTTDELNKYTITSPTTVANPGGVLWYNKDLANAVSNSSGTMQIELEEII